MTEQTVIPPPVMWAQRSNVVLLTINLEDVKDPDVKFTRSSVYFKGVGGLERKTYEVTVPLYREIDAEKSKSFNRGRCIEVVLVKANQEESYWPALTSDKKKHHWLKCDFNKWQDEDESADEGLAGMGGGGGGGGGDFEEMLRQVSGGAKPSFGDEVGGEPGERDSDDESIPDLE